MSPSGNPANDFHARSFFDVYVQVALPHCGGLPPGTTTLYNRHNQPLKVHADLPGPLLPPSGVIYMHDRSTAVPILFATTNGKVWRKDEVLGCFVLAGTESAFKDNPGEREKFEQHMRPHGRPAKACTGGIISQGLPTARKPSLTSEPSAPWRHVFIFVRKNRRKNRVKVQRPRMLNLLNYLRYALRQFRMSPVFAAAAVLTLALGIGGTTAIFTLIHAVMLRSLPVSDPGRLYRVGEGDDCCVEGTAQGRWGMFSYRLFERLKAEVPEFEQVAAFQAGGWTSSVRREGVESAGRPLNSEYVTGNYFSTLGVGAFGGRLFTPDDDRPGAPPVAVLSHHV